MLDFTKMNITKYDARCRIGPWVYQVFDSDATTLKIDCSSHPPLKAFDKRQDGNDYRTGPTYSCRVKIEDTDCIWELAHRYDSESVRVHFGNLVAEEMFHVDRQDMWDAEFCKRDTFAVYKGRSFRIFSGQAMWEFYRLTTNIYELQRDHFIYAEPGVYEKVVPAVQIEFAFEASTKCLYHGREFFVDSQTTDGIVIEPSRRDLYGDEELLQDGFRLHNTKMQKTIFPTEADEIWYAKIPIHGFKKRKVESIRIR